MQKRIWIFFSIIVLSPMHQVIAIDAETFFRSPSVKLAIVKSTGNIKVSSKDQFDKVPFSSSSLVTPVLTLIQPPAYFLDETRWGYHTEISTTYFLLDYDEDDLRYRDGDFEGYSLSVTPVLFYQWGDKELCSHCKSWRIELGAGVNYLNSEGDLTAENGEKLRFGNTGFGFNSHLGVVVNFKKWELGLRMVVPTRVDDQNVKVRHALSSIGLGYRF
ncbi:hypothetical protein [uncultured Photobacterium sp.]|uniref:hypothetical protein n=1 Tax=uncultured Photobacterium sp. TaxID=173973 RepID=UPI00262FD11C|nr:hypothetical protein [uncultured Photobacterium sp.]